MAEGLAGTDHRRDRAGASATGAAPLRVLFERVAVPCAQHGTKGAWLGSRRLMAIDGFVLDIPDTKENDGKSSEIL